ncbi:MAG: hypothetical protein ABUK01_05595 [Leptospirales bacterium]
MNVNHSVILTLLFMQLYCAPVQYTEQNQGVPIQQIEGFIDKDNHQALCSVSLEKQEEKKNQLVDACRIKTVQQWASYKLEFKNYKMSDSKMLSFENFRKKSKTKTFKKVRWSDKQTADLLLAYKDLFPGRMVYETTLGGKWNGTYRVSRKDLLNTIIRRPIKLIPGKINKKGQRKTIFK